MEFKRCSGILMPISSLPGGYGIGSMGKPAHDFVDFLAKAGQTIWQILPVGPTGYADSPYQSCSAFAGNPYFIDLDLLAADGLLTKKDYAAINWGGDAAHVDYGTLYEKRFAVLRKAYANFLKKRPVPGYETPYPDDWYRFRFLSSDWLPDYCLYMAIKEANGMVDWQQWPRALRVREPEALAEFKAEHAGEIEFWAFLQYEFDRQWRALHAYAKEKGVAIMGDIPIYVAADSADAWAGRELFETDAEGKPRRVAGCPPDYFAADGQLWGNPLYDWDYHKTTGYKWWIDRIRRQLTLTDYLRIDHFRGFEAYWSVPAEEETAINGKWVKGPCEDLFHAIEKALGSNLPIFAEDLGIITPEVEHLRDSLGFPGMKVLQFGFGDLNDKNYVPHFYTSPNCICYTGTHDNDTTMGWYAQQPEVIRDRVRRYGNTDGNMVSLDFIRFCMASIAKYAIFPIQDLCLMGSDARMNTPGVAAANWAFRYVKEDLTQERKNWLLKTTRLFGRCPLGPEDYTV